MESRTASIVESSRAIAPAMVELRREIHRNPEVGWREHRTTRRVAEALVEMGLDPQIRSAGTGLTVDIGSGDTAVGFRADLDALPITEISMADYASLVPGTMHACGHDVHVAVAVGIAGVLAAQPELPGRVRIVFQPAEEQIPGGAVAMSAEGAIDGLAAIAAFHVDPSLPVGHVGLRHGGITGAADKVIIRLKGPGGHTSRPHQTADLIYAAGRVATELPQLLRYGADPRETMAVVFGRIAGGGAENVIPTEVEMGGTIRLFNLDLWRELPKLVEQHVHDLVSPLGAALEIDYLRGSPPVVNDSGVVRAFDQATRQVCGDGCVAVAHQSLGSEDFAWFLEALPGALIRLGAGLPDRTVDLHSATFDVDEGCIETGIGVGSQAMINLLESVAAPA